MGKLSDQQKIEIVERYKSKSISIAQLAREYNVWPNGIKGILKTRKVEISYDSSENKRKYTLDQEYFDYIDSEDKAYFLGLLYADGYNYEKRSEITLSLQERDSNILERFNVAVNSNRPIFLLKSKKDQHQNKSILEINSKHMSTSLSNLGCVQKKSLILKFPTDSQVPNFLTRHFVRGYFDGDGSIMQSKIRDLYPTANLASSVFFCNHLKTVLDAMNITSSIYDTKNEFTKILFFTNRRSTLDFLNWIYKKSNVYLERKYKKYISVCNHKAIV